MRTFRKSSGLSIAVFLLGIMTVQCTLGTRLAAAGELSPELKQEFDRGLLAAQANDFELANRYFSRVQEKELLYPPLLFNLGLAAAQAGNPFAAIAWFEAYLLLDPQAENRDEIRQEIMRLEQEAQKKADDIFDGAEKAAANIQGTDSSNRSSAYSYLAQVSVSGGEDDVAARLLTNDPGLTDPAKSLTKYKNYRMITLARLGEIEAAEKIARETDWSTTEQVSASTGFEIVARAKMDAGDLMGGWALLRQIPPMLRENLTWPFLDRFRQDNDFVPIEQVIQESGEKAGEALFILAKHKIKQGDTSGALALASHYQSPVYKARFQLRVADLLMQNGDERVAKRVAEDVAANESARSSDPSNQYWHNDFRVQIMGLRGDLDEAFAAAEVMPLSDFSPSNRAAAFGLIIQWAVLKGDEKKAQKLLKRAVAHPEGIRQTLVPYTWYALALMIQGRLAEAEAMLLNIGDDYSDLKSLELMRLADHYLAKDDQKAAIEVLLKGEQLPNVAPSFTVKLAELLIKAGQFDKALEVAQKGYAKQTKARVYIEDAKQIEKTLRLRVRAEQEKKGVSAQVVEWVVLARLVSDFVNTDADMKNIPIQRASQPDSPEVLVLDTALVAQNLKNILFMIENVRSGKKAVCAYLIAGQSLTT